MSLKVTDVMTITGMGQCAVNDWILKGWLKAEKEVIRGIKGIGYVIDERDLMAFMASEHYKGHPEDILYARMFNRVPVIDDCYPLNLIADVLEINLDDESVNENDDTKSSVYDVNIREFKTLISKLTDREQRLIEMRYQFGLTFDECAKIFGVTKERIRQIILKAERKLKHGILLGKCFMVPKTQYEGLARRYKILSDKYEELEKRLDEYVGNEQNVKETRTIDLFTVDIAPLDLTVRSYNCLKRSGVDTLGDILSFDQHQGKDSPYRFKTWQEIRNLGRKSLMEIARKTFDYCGYRIRQYNVETEKYDGTIPLLEGEDYVIGGVDYSVEASSL